MIEAYAFLAIFAVQILAMSVVHPAWYIQVVRKQELSFPAERFAQRYPGVDYRKIVERNLTRYRVANAVIALLGVVLLGWQLTYAQRPDWYDGPVAGLVFVYFFLQALPLLVGALLALKYNKLLAQLQEGKRTAVLERRGLFDFVSPYAVVLAVLSYLLFVAYTFYIARHPFPGFGGALANIGILTLGYAFLAFCAYRTLYTRKVNSLVTHAAHMHEIGMAVRSCVYMAIAAPVGASVNFSLKLLDLPSWEPFAGSAYFVFIALLMRAVMTAPPHRPELEGRGAEQPT